MRFGFDEDQLALRDAVRRFCDDRLDLIAVAGREGKPAPEDVWAGLADLGVLGMLVPDSGLGIVDAAIVFEELGASIVVGPVLWSVLAAPHVPGVTDGEVRVAGVDRASHPLHPVVVEHVDECDALLLLAEDRVELCAKSELEISAAGSSFDPLTPTASVAFIPTGQAVGSRDDVDRVRLLGTILSSALLVGGARRSLDVARAYALERHQFGVPIGSFQAVKHLLADMYVRLELASSATYAAAAVAADPRAGDPERAASAAKLLAGEAGIGNARTAVQVLGGMGFTWEMLPHYFLKRAWALEQAFGTTEFHAARLADGVAADAGSAEYG
jgi:alkylation response protein AidB-like acyl-CoA dehydrogenase